MRAHPDSQLFLLLSGHLLGSTFPAWQLAKSLKEVSWRNCKFHLVSFSSLRDHFCLYSLMSCVSKMVISCILSLFVPDGRVNLVPPTPIWLKCSHNQHIFYYIETSSAELTLLRHIFPSTFIRILLVFLIHQRTKG